MQTFVPGVCQVKTKNLKRAFISALTLNILLSPMYLIADVRAEQTTPSADNQNVAETKKATENKTDNQPVQQPESQTEKAQSVMWKPGDSLSIGTDTEDLVPTDDVELAKKQAAAYPDNPEASFILAVALTRTSRVEEALQEVRRARKLAENKGGPAYFDKMIASYEQMLKNFPDENRVRYGLAWAYYMKAYLLSKYSKRSVAWKAAHEQQNLPKAQTNNVPVPQPKSKDLFSQVSNIANALATNKTMDPKDLPHIPTAIEDAEPSDIPQIKKYYELALAKLDELLVRNPNDVWATVYRAHLKAEYSGNLEEAMVTWRKCQTKYPNNPASYFFLGEGYLKQGNLKESINNVSRAISLRALGN